MSKYDRWTASQWADSIIKTYNYLLVGASKTWFPMSYETRSDQAHASLRLNIDAIMYILKDKGYRCEYVNDKINNNIVTTIFLEKTTNKITEF